MKNLNKLIYLIIFLAIISCRKENENDPAGFIDYPEFTHYGENILFWDKTYIEDNRNYSMAVNLPENGSIRVKLKGGRWDIPRQEPIINWNTLPYNKEDKSKIFESAEPGKECDLKIYFDIPPVRDTFMWGDSIIYGYKKGERDTVTVEYYENMSELPTRTKTIFIDRNNLRDDLSASEFKNALIGKWQSVFELEGWENVTYLKLDNQGKAGIILEKDGVSQEYSGDYTVDFIYEPMPENVTLAEITISGPEKEIVLSRVNFGLHNAFRYGIFLRIEKPPLGVLERVK
jgi:hypothetical protein